ncbi:MAG: ATP-grasp domain-containing protein [Clostridia bacterium]|nr:ATP-grasp domain-containing protein [Clostridia bacterium]
MEKTITPVIVGADLNCYNVARAFHEAYGVKSHAFGRYAVSATKYSKIVDFKTVADMNDDAVMLDQLHRFADAHLGDKMPLFACTDDYAAMIIRNREELSDFIIPYPPASMLASVSKKAEFYEACDRFGIPHPKTVVLTEKTTEGDVEADKLGFGYPIIVKPSSSADYWKHEFEGMKKVYIAKTPDEAVKIVNEIYSSGYPEKMILQEFIAGGDSQMRVLTCFSDAKGKVRAMCLGHTMLEEHTPKGLGNHAAIVTEPVSSLPLAEKIKDMLEAIGYTGFSNFDIKLREGTTDDYRVFEVNLRQGRSNFYLTAAGLNVGRLAAEVYESDGDDCVRIENSIFWHHIPKSTAYTYTEDKELVARAKALAKEGKESSSVWYRPDMAWNPLRTICVLEQLRRQKQKFKIYYPKKP